MQTAWLLVVVAVAFCGLADSACETPWKDCGSTDMKIGNVHVENCCSAPCKAILGQSTTFSFTFTLDKAYKGLTQIACAVIGGECLKFPDEKFGDMCNCDECTITPANKICPFEANIMYNITVDVPLSTAFPKVTAIAEWKISDPSTKTQIGCFEVPVQTVDP